MDRQTARTLELAGIAWRRAAEEELRQRAARDDLIRTSAAAGASAGKIARAVGIERSHVHRILSGDRGARTVRR